MKRWHGVLAVLALAIINAGCGGSGSPPAADQGAGGEAAAAAANFPPPEAAVNEFLTAVKTGNDEKAAQMLTPLAREKTAALDMVVAPPGSDTASFKIGEVEVVDQEVAHVECTWTDVGEDGQPHSEQIIWMLRLETDGWRIAGMATQIFPNEPPLLLNFEDPEDMLAKQQMAEEELVRRAQGLPPMSGPSTQPEQTTAPAATQAAQPAPVAPVRQ